MFQLPVIKRGTLLLAVAACVTSAILWESKASDELQLQQYISFSTPINPSLPITELPTTQGVPMLWLKISDKAQYSDLKSFTIKANGTIDESVDVTSVWLYYDENEVLDSSDYPAAGPEYFFEDDGEITFDIAPQNDASTGSIRYIVVLNMSGSASYDETLSLSIPDADHVSLIATEESSIPVHVNGDFPIESPCKPISNIGTLIFSGKNRKTWTNSGEYLYDHLRFTLTNNNVEPVLLGNITVRSAGSVDEDDAFETDSIRIYYENGENAHPHHESFEHNNGAILFDGPYEIIPVNGSVTLDVYFILEWNVDAEWTEVYVDLAEISATGMNSNEPVLKMGEERITYRIDVGDPEAEDHNPWCFLAELCQ